MSTRNLVLALSVIGLVVFLTAPVSAAGVEGAKGDNVADLCLGFAPTAANVWTGEVWFDPDGTKFNKTTRLQDQANGEFMGVGGIHVMMGSLPIFVEDGLKRVWGGTNGPFTDFSPLKRQMFFIDPPFASGNSPKNLGPLVDSPWIDLTAAQRMQILADMTTAIWNPAYGTGASWRNVYNQNLTIRFPSTVASADVPPIIDEIPKKTAPVGSVFTLDFTGKVTNPGNGDVTWEMYPTNGVGYPGDNPPAFDGNVLNWDLNGVDAGTYEIAVKAIETPKFGTGATDAEQFDIETFLLQVGGLTGNEPPVVNPIDDVTVTWRQSPLHLVATASDPEGDPITGWAIEQFGDNPHLLKMPTISTYGMINWDFMHSVNALGTYDFRVVATSAGIGIPVSSNPEAFSVTIVPEPSILIMLMSSAMLGLYLWRRRHN